MLQWQNEFVHIYLKLPLFLQATFTIFFYSWVSHFLKKLDLLFQVDIDIKLRSCKGSCGGYSEYQVDTESYVTLNKQVRIQATASIHPVKGE